MAKRPNNIADEECKQAVIFARVSSEEQTRGASLDAQLKSVKDYCENITPNKPNELKVIKIFSIKESSTRGERKLFYEMLDFVKKQKHKTAIVVNCVDRLQRGYKECVELDDLRSQGRIELHFYKEGLILHKNSTSSDIMRWDMGVLSAKMYVGSLRDNVIRSMEYKRENGQLQSAAPVGYLNVSKTKTTAADVIIDPERAPKVKRLFEEYAKGGRTLQDITNFARDIGLCSRLCKINKTISRGQVYQILQNTFYIGYMKSKGKIYEHYYEKFIDKELFDIVQDVMNDRKRAPSKLYYGEKQYVFNGLVKCGTCGCLMTSETRTKPSGKSYTYLKCNTLRAKCSQKPINEQVLLDELEKMFLNGLNVTDSMLVNIKKLVREQLKKDTEVKASDKRNITIKIEELKSQEKQLFKYLLQHKCDEETFNESKAGIRDEIAKLEKSADKYEEDNAKIEDILMNIAEIAANASIFIKSPIISQKKDFLNLILSDSKIEGKKPCFTIGKPFDRLVKTAETEKWCRRRESDLRPHPYQGCALPLSYGGICFVIL